MPEQRVQLAQRLDTDHRLVSHAHEVTNAVIKHPQRNLDGASIELRRQTAANDPLPLTDPRAVHPNQATKPRVPAIADLSRLGTMGVSLLARTTASGATAHSVTCVRSNMNDAGRQA